MTGARASHPLTVPVLDAIGQEQVQTALATSIRLLMESRARTRILLSREWARQFPNESGVYAVFDRGTLVYVGETGSLSGRMADLIDSRNHVLRRSLGNQKFKDVPGFVRASAHKRFPDHIEDRVTEYIQSYLSVAAVVVPIGRAEIEEHVTGKHRPLYNRKGKRGTKLREPKSDGGVA